MGPEQPLETRDTYDEAWELAKQYRDTAAKLGVRRLLAVRPLVVIDSESHRKTTVYGVYVADD